MQIISCQWFTCQHYIIFWKYRIIVLILQSTSSLKVFTLQQDIPKTLPHMFLPHWIDLPRWNGISDDELFPTLFDCGTCLWALPANIILPMVGDVTLTCDTYHYELLYTQLWRYWSNCGFCGDLYFRVCNTALVISLTNLTGTALLITSSVSSCKFLLQGVWLAYYMWMKKMEFDTHTPFKIWQLSL